MDNFPRLYTRVYTFLAYLWATVESMKSLTPLSLVAHAHAVFPDFQIVGLTEPSDTSGQLMRQGVVDAQGERWVIVAPLDSSVGVEIAAQSTLLRFLHLSYERGFIPFDVPVPVASTRGDSKVPLFIYRQVSGQPVSYQDLVEVPSLAGSLGRALAALHNLPAEIMERTGLPLYSAADCRERLRVQLTEAAKAWPLPDNLYARWANALDDDSLFNFTTVPVHGNLEVEAFLCSRGVVTTMSDFAAASLGDPAEDVASFYTSEDEGVAERFTHAYLRARKDGADIHLLSRAQLYSELALVRWLLHGIRSEDAQIIADAKGLLGELSAQLGDVPLLPEHAEQERGDFSLVDVVASLSGSQPAAVDTGALTVVLDEVLALREDSVE